MFENHIYFAYFIAIQHLFEMNLHEKKYCKVDSDIKCTHELNGPVHWG